MQYQVFSAEDFIQDEAFRQWVFSPNDRNCEFWDTFLLNYPFQRMKVQEAREFLLGMRFAPAMPDELVQRIKCNFNNAIDEYEASHPRPVRSKIRSVASGRRFLGKISYAAAACFLLFAVSAVYLIMPKGVSGSIFHALTFETQKTLPGKKRQVILSDGTHVWLNANSELSFPKNFSEKNIREVYLEGEAFFDVAENRQKAFIVHTSGVHIKVLGTSFNVRSYADDDVVETTLVKGKVSIASTIEDSVHQVTLLPNQQALFSKDSKTIALEDVDNTENFTSWKNGWMIFDNKPFSYISETLERWYGVNIIMEDQQSLTCTFSAKFKDKTLQEVLEIFKNTESINYRIDGDDVFIDGRLCQYENPN